MVMDSPLQIDMVAHHLVVNKVARDRMEVVVVVQAAEAKVGTPPPVYQFKLSCLSDS